ncbi:TPA: CRISPR-associated helicase Cas3', partial [Escherichia coli]
AKVAPFNGINTLFPFIENPTPLQQKVLDLDISQQGPQLFILEDVTGAGKTEAALILAHRLIAAGKAQGLFFGLPTMATANAMYDRLVKTWLAFYSPESRPSLVLAHSARTLMDRFNESLWSGDLVGSEEPDEQTFSQGCAAWFADSNKKALLAEIGVGTLDQAMMAVMPFKHNNLRLLGLSNKILLADEIHACDAYMSCILEGLIERQARGGNSVILLSATLSQQQRDKLVAAFARGTEGQQEAPFLEKDDYPWLTHVTKSDVNSHRVATRKDVERSVSVGWLHSEQECIARIESAVSQGKCIAWIRNSVDDAIKVHRQLLARGVIPASSLSLFHSRFAFSDRQRIETETLARFGKYCSLQRASQVIVCTQVIEQSVDIDLDEMISDLAPVDLLIQRAGRLQRHIRDINGQLPKLRLAAQAASHILSLLHRALKEAWFSEKKTTKLDFGFVDIDFWNKTQHRFLRLVRKIEEGQDPDELLSKWQKEMWLFARQDFDDRVFTNPYEPVDLERVMTARKKYFTTSAEKQNANAAREKKQEAAE